MALYQSVKRNFRKTRTVKETRKSAKDGRSNKDKPAIDRRVQPFLFPEKREKYYQQHKKEINYYRKCERELKQHLDKNGKVPTARWKREKEELRSVIEELKADNQPYQDELVFVKRYRVVQTLPDVTGKWQKQIPPGVQKKKGEADEVPGISRSPNRS